MRYHAVRCVSVTPQIGSEAREDGNYVRELCANCLNSRRDQTVECYEMNAIKSALLMGLALCVAASSGLARETGSHAKSTRTEKSSRSSSGKSRKASGKSRKAKARKSEARASRGSETER